MSRANIPFLAFNRGLIAPSALARVDLPRTALSAEVMTNWLPKTQGEMRLRPGTKYVGSTLNDTGAYFIEFVASTEDVALLELTDSKMRVWLGSDAHDLSLLSRSPVNTTLALSDTGWYSDNDGGGTRSVQGVNAIPVMTAATTGGATISASNVDGSGFEAWRAADGDYQSRWIAGSAPTEWIKVDLGTTKQIEKLSLTAGPTSTNSRYAPLTFTLQGNDVDTGTGWTTEVSVSTTNWATGETRVFTDTGYTDTGANAWRYWRVNTTATQLNTDVAIADMKLIQAASAVSDTGQVVFGGSGLSLNAGAKGSIARVTKAVVVSDTGTEHSLAVAISRGPVVIRVGSTEGNDDLVLETSLATGYHNLAFTPQSTIFYVTLQTEDGVDRIVSSCSIGDTGTVELITPWSNSDLENIRFDQSADVVFVNSKNVRQQRIERRGTGRSWSVVDYVPRFGPFRGRNSAARLDLSERYGNTTLGADSPFFSPGHIGALFQLTHGGQSFVQKLGNYKATTDSVEVTGIGDTGTASANNERQISFSVAGTYIGTIEIQRSYDGPDYGFHPASPDFMAAGAATDTGTFTRTINDEDNNVAVWYRAEIKSWTSGTAFITIVYKNGLRTAIVRVTGFTDNQTVDAEIIREPSDTGPTADWSEGSWSDRRGYPSAVALHEGRLAHAGLANIWISASDDYDNFDEAIEGDASPINRTLGSGPVDNIYYLLSLQRLVAGSAGAEISIKSSSIDEVLTPENAAARYFSSQGSSNLRAVRRDQEGYFVQRSNRRFYQVGGGNAFGDYTTSEMTLLVPELLKGGVVSATVQRQPDTRFHLALTDGTVAILTYEPSPEREDNVICWSKWQTDTGTGGIVERVMTLPGLDEDAVYYLIKRTINGVTKRYLEKWAKEDEATGDTGLSYLADCAAFFQDTGTSATRPTAITGFQHLAGASAVVWADDTGATGIGQNDAGRDLSYDTGGVQQTYAVGTSAGATDTGEITLTSGVKHAVAGLPYKATWKSTKLAYAAEAGTALAQMKRTDKMGLILSQTHNNGLFYGRDTGNIDPLPRILDAGARVDVNKIYLTLDEVAIPFPGLWSEDSRIVLVAKSPRPATVMAVVPTVQTNEREAQDRQR